MTSEELDVLMTEHGYEGKRGAVALGILVGLSYRTIYRLRTGDMPIRWTYEVAIRQALGGARSAAVAPRPARRSKTQK